MRSNRKKRNLGLFAMLLALIGIGSCNVAEDIDETLVAAYGTPTVHYTVHGKVTDPNGNPIEGIQVTVGTAWTDDLHNYYTHPIEAPVTTDRRGKWIREAYFYPSDSLHIQVKDIDGAEHGGEFADYQTSLPVKIVKNPKNTNPWYMGDATVNVSDIKLKKK